jgi:predicted RecA/RadA family phage recombinase
MDATLIQESGVGTVQFAASADVVAGEIIAVPDGRIGVVAGISGSASGDQVATHVGGVFKVAIKSTDVVAIGDDLYWDLSQDHATKTEGANHLLGSAFTAAGNGVVIGQVSLNVWHIT